MKTVRISRYNGNNLGLYIAEVWCKAFNSVERNLLLVDHKAKDVRAWDSVAGHYTTCHNLSQKTMDRVIKAVSEVAQ